MLNKEDYIMQFHLRGKFNDEVLNFDKESFQDNKTLL